MHARARAGGKSNALFAYFFQAVHVRMHHIRMDMRGFRECCCVCVYAFVDMCLV